MDVSVEFGKSPFDESRQRRTHSHSPAAADLNADPAPSTSYSASWPLRHNLLDDFESQTIAAEIQRIRRRFDAPMSDASATASPSPHFEPPTSGANIRRSVAESITERGEKSPTPNTTSSVQHQFRRSSPFAWTAIAFGLMSFVCGAILLGWSLVTDRRELWNVGLPITLVGQFALLFGLVWQLDGLWQGNHDAAEKLDDVDDRLDDLKKTTALLSTAQSSPAQKFYVHMPSGAGPEFLLADLKGQLDLQATQMAEERR
ncbi:MAG TPA: hypothetical protein VKB78_08775 [Pirellulales bacterium]|nr:hypothetical protein [Pirellulales bacterium]